MSGVFVGKNTGKRKCLYFNFIPCIIQRLMLTFLTLLIRRKNPVIADFTVAKRNRQDAKKVLHSAFNRNRLTWKTTRKHF